MIASKKNGLVVSKLCGIGKHNLFKEYFMDIDRSKSRRNFCIINTKMAKLQNNKKNLPSSFQKILAGKVLHVAAGVF